MSITFVNIRLIRHSLVEHVASHFATPPSLMGWSRAFNVYNEADMRAAGFATTEPYVFIISASAEPMASRVPMVMVNTTFILDSYQLGSRAGSRIDVNLSCFGRDRPEREDMASMLANVYDGRTEINRAIPIWTSLSDSTQAGVAEVTSPVVIAPMSVSDELAAEGSLRNWTVVSFAARIV